MAACHDVSYLGAVPGCVALGGSSVLWLPACMESGTDALRKPVMSGVVRLTRHARTPGMIMLLKQAAAPDFTDVGSLCSRCRALTAAAGATLSLGGMTLPELLFQRTSGSVKTAWPWPGTPPGASQLHVVELRHGGCG